MLPGAKSGPNARREVALMMASLLISSLSRAPSLFVSPRSIRNCIRSGNSSLVILPSLFLSNAISRATMSSTPGPLGPLGKGFWLKNCGGESAFWSGACATAAPVRRSAAVKAGTSNRLMLRMLLLHGGQRDTSLEWVRELRIGNKLVVGERLQEGNEGGLVGIREIKMARRNFRTRGKGRRRCGIQLA